MGAILSMKRHVLPPQRSIFTFLALICMNLISDGMRFFHLWFLAEQAGFCCAPCRLLIFALTRCSISVVVVVCCFFLSVHARQTKETQFFLTFINYLIFIANSREKQSEQTVN